MSYTYTTMSCIICMLPRPQRPFFFFSCASQDPLYPFVCADCKAGFNAAKALDFHLKEVHKVKEREEKTETIIRSGHNTHPAAVTSVDRPNHAMLLHCCVAGPPSRMFLVARTAAVIAGMCSPWVTKEAHVLAWCGGGKQKIKLY